VSICQCSILFYHADIHLSPLGTVTRSQAWTTLVRLGRVKDGPTVANQEITKKATLEAQFRKIDTKKWKEEKDMYLPIIEAMRSRFYSKKADAVVVDTHMIGDFRPDISVADFKDDRLLYTLWYFIELKLPGINLLTAENCGQVVDYFQKAHEKQRHRSDFIALLSNFTSTWVFTAQYTEMTVNISKQPASTFADAIIYADVQSRKQSRTRISLDSHFASDYTILNVARHHFLLRVQMPTPTSPTHENDLWRSPTRHSTSSFFVLKIAHDETTVANEIDILKKIRDMQCIHLPELVWAPEGDQQLGIVPVGTPIDFRQAASVSRKIVNGLVDGLEYLHGQGIVHRDLRPSNLVLDAKNNVIIIDYETAVVVTNNASDVYLGGYICWPKRLLESSTSSDLYQPKPADDLFACILVVLHLLFPSSFDAFRASSIMPSPISSQRNKETQQLLSLWEGIEQSKIWGFSIEAAETRNYEVLKNMADVFCHF
jgi:hypothetical protein